MHDATVFALYMAGGFFGILSIKTVVDIFTGESEK